MQKHFYEGETCRSPPNTKRRTQTSADLVQSSAGSSLGQMSTKRGTIEDKERVLSHYSFMPTTMTSLNVYCKGWKDETGSLLKGNTMAFRFCGIGQATIQDTSVSMIHALFHVRSLQMYFMQRANEGTMRASQAMINMSKFGLCVKKEKEIICCELSSQWPSQKFKLFLNRWQQRLQTFLLLETLSIKSVRVCVYVCVFEVGLFCNQWDSRTKGVHWSMLLIKCLRICWSGVLSPLQEVVANRWGLLVRVDLFPDTGVSPF